MTTQVQSELIKDGSITTAKFDPAAVCPNATNATNATTATTVPNAAITPAKLSQPLTQMTMVATSSGTFIDITGIPSWAKRITLMLAGVGKSAGSSYLIQLGYSGGVWGSGYVSGSTSVSTSTANSTGGNSSTAGFTMNTNNSASSVSGIMTLVNHSGTAWVSSHNINTTAGQNATISGAGLVSLPGTLDRLRFTTTTGTDTFTTGNINVLYEG